MADPRDEQPTGRMLFTDFDASDKGRPTVDLAQMQADSRRSPRQHKTYMSLDDLASSLNFGFEDDDGESEPSPSARQTTTIRNPVPARGEASAPERESDPERHAEPESDEEGIWSGRQGKEPLHHHSAIPTWDQYANSFMRASRPSDEDDHAVEHEQPFSPSRRTTARHEPQFVAMIQPLPDEEDRDEDVDILSLLPSGPKDDEEQVYEPFEGDRRSHLPGPQSPSTHPYGGIQRLDEWYRPPENTAEDHKIESVPGWYEPPEVETRRPHSRRTTARYAEKPAGKGKGSLDFGTDSKAPPGKSQSGTDVTQSLDIFRGVDLDSLWEKKLEAKRDDTEADHTPTSIRNSHFFDDLDLDEAWDQKQSEVPNNAPTVILPLSQAPSASKKVPKQPSAPGGNAADDDTEQSDFLQGLDKLFGDMPENDPLKAETHPLPGAVSAPSSKSEPAEEAHSEPGSKFVSKPEAVTPPAAEYINESDTFDLDRLIAMTDTDEPAVNDSVATPVVGDADVIDLRKKKKSESENRAETVSLNAPFPISGSAEEKDMFDGSKNETAEADYEEAYIPSDAISTESGEENAPSADPGEVKGERAAEAHTKEEAIAVNPLDVFANMNELDFSDDAGLDDEMKAMLDTEAEGEWASEEKGKAGEMNTASVEDKPPSGIAGKSFYFTKKAVGKAIPLGFVTRIMDLIAWKENWWFYCDLLAALIASASLAIIISYYVWYKH